MNMTKWIIVLVIIIIAIVGIVLYMRYRNKQLYQMFEQVYVQAKQVPKQKKHSFLLFMFKEGLSAAKNKKSDPQSRMNNPKYVETQLIQMSNILKDTSKVKDKKMKQVLKVYNAYLQWEKANK